jgi:hypothetical protein
MRRKEAKYGGRPRGSNKDRAGEFVGFRAPKELKERLVAAAEASDRSISTEAQFRLERSFRDDDLVPQVLSAAYGPQFAGIILAVGRAMHIAGRHAGMLEGGTIESIDNWVNSPWAFRQAHKAAEKILEAVQPDGPISAPPQPRGNITTESWEKLRDGCGDLGAAEVVRAVHGQTMNRDLERWAEPIRKLLGPLAEPRKE